MSELSIAPSTMLHDARLSPGMWVADAIHESMVMWDQDREAWCIGRLRDHIITDNQLIAIATIATMWLREEQAIIWQPEYYPGREGERLVAFERRWLEVVAARRNSLADRNGGLKVLRRDVSVSQPDHVEGRLLSIVIDQVLEPRGLRFPLNREKIVFLLRRLATELEEADDDA